jgi:tetratricopeptide (TPR) repeat protein
MIRPLLLLALGWAGCAPHLSRSTAAKNLSDQRQATQYFIQSKVFEEQDNYLGAIVALRSAADLDPTSPTIFAQLARHYRQIGDHRMATTYAEKSLQLGADQSGLRLRLVRWYDGLGDAAASARHVEILIERDPHNWQLYSHLSRLYMAIGKQGQIDDLFDRLLKAPDTPIDVRVNAAFVISRNGRRAKAVKVFRSILTVDPTIEDAWLGLGEALVAQQQKDAAREVYRQGARHVPDSSLLIYELARLIETPAQLGPVLETEDPAYLYRLGASLSDLERFDLATRVFEKIVGRRPQTIEGWLDPVTYYLRVNDVDRALGILAEAVAVMPDSLDISLALASTLERAGRDEEATAVYEGLAQRGIKELDLFIYWGIHHEKASRWPQAIDAYRHGMVALGEVPELYIRWGIALSRQERWHEAADRYRKAAAIDSFFVDAHLHLGIALDRIGRRSDSIERLEMAHRMNPASTAIMFYLGSVLERESRDGGDEALFERAVKVFEELIDVSPQDAYALNYLGYMFAERGVRLEEAIALLNLAISVDPQNSAFFDSLGWAYYQLGQFSEAEQYLGKAIAQMIESDDGDEEELAVIFDHAGDIAAALGKQAQALDLWRQALELTPGDGEIQRKLDTP